MKNKEKRIYVIVIATVLLLTILTIYRCPIKYIFGLSCPFCGITRAFYYAIQLNFSKAFYYHLLWPIVLVILIFHILIEFDVIKINKKIAFVTLYTFCIVNLIYYFYRLFNNPSIVYFNFEKSLIKRIIDLIF